MRLEFSVRFRKICVGSSLFLLFTLHASASEILRLNRFKDIAQLVQEKAQRVGAQNVLWVMDLDNTILAMNQDLGSEPWFNWQTEMLAKRKSNPSQPLPGLIAPDFQALLLMNGYILALSAMHPVEKDVPSLIEQMQLRKVSSIVLTARGREYRDATLRQLDENRIDLFKAAPILQGSGSEVFSPYDPRNLHQAGFSPDEAKKLGLSQAPRKVEYSEGVFFTAGQHKGAMLKVLLHRFKKKFREVVFVENTLTHCERVEEVFKKAPGKKGAVKVTSVLYTKQDSDIQRFNQGDKSEVIQSQNKFLETLKNVFPRRAQ